MTMNVTCSGRSVVHFALSIPPPFPGLYTSLNLDVGRRKPETQGQENDQDSEQDKKQSDKEEEKDGDGTQKENEKGMKEEDGEEEEGRVKKEESVQSSSTENTEDADDNDDEDNNMRCGSEVSEGSLLLSMVNGMDEEDGFDMMSYVTD